MANVKPNTIPQKYQKYGAKRGFHPKEFSELNWFIQGTMGTGKSNLVSSIPGGLHLDIEDGAHSVTNDDAVRIPIGRNIKTFLDIIADLKKDGEAAGGDQEKLPFQQIIFDPVDGLLDMMFDLICEEKGEQHNKSYEYIGEIGQRGAGYNFAYVRVIGILSLLEKLGYSWVLTCHRKTKDVTFRRGGKEETVTIVRPSIGDSIARVLENRADMTAVLAWKTEVREQTKKKKIKGGKTVNVKNKETVRNLVMGVESTESSEAKRRVYTFKGDYVVPRQGAWDEISERYAEAVAEMEQELASQKENTDA